MDRDQLIERLLEVSVIQAKNIERLLEVAASSELRMERVNHIVDTLTTEYSRHLDMATGSRDMAQKTLDVITANQSAIIKSAEGMKDSLDKERDRYDRLVSILERMASASGSSTNVSIGK